MRVLYHAITYMLMLAIGWPALAEGGVLDANTGGVRCVINSDPGPYLLTSTFSPDGALMATTCAEGFARVWHVATGRPVAVMTDWGGRMEAARFSDDGRTLVTLDARGSLLTWDIASATVRIRREVTRSRTFTGGDVNPPCAIGAGGKRVAFTMEHSKSVHLWDGDMAAAQVPVGRCEAPARAMALSPGEHFLAVGDEGGVITLWDADARRVFDYVIRGRGPVRSLAFSPDGRRLAVCAGDGAVRLYAMATGAQVGEDITAVPHALAVRFTAAGDVLVVVGYDLANNRWVAAHVEPGSGRAHRTANLTTEPEL